MSDTPAPASAPRGVRLIAATRLIQARNAIDQRLREAPWQTLAVLVLLGSIWTALYYLLDHVLRQIRAWGLVGIVADEHLFVHFFAVLAVMLAFSNAVLMFGNLYGRHEAAHLLSTPLRPRHVVTVKWVESMVLSSWAFLLLGVPLMFAAANNATVQWYYYPLFLAHFIGFIAIPACIGMLAACAVALWAPRQPLVVALGGGAALLLGTIYWFLHLSNQATESEQLLRLIFRQVGVIKQTWLPTTWTAKGIVAAVNQRADESVFYLLVVAGNAAFLAWLTINVIARSWPRAYSAAQLGRHRATIRDGWPTRLLCTLLFFYLPRAPFRVMLKDLRTFLRDARQWSQMVIMLGLLIIYVLNLTRLPFDMRSVPIKAMIAFLNLTVISLILATFTSRFMYPLLSLESQQLWLMEMLPVRRSTLLWVKFLFALMVTGACGLAVMTLACQVLDLPPLWARVNLLICGAICIGLSGLAIGLGARFPVTGQRNPARIAASLGGTLNLVASMLFVCLQIAGVAFIGLKSIGPIGNYEYGAGVGTFDDLHRDAWQMLWGLLLLGAAVAAGAMHIGVRHFRRLEI